MARWEPDARGRLEQAAMALFQERGYARTTVEEIATRAGLTERTFFRYFADKREVLFWGAAALRKLIVDAIVDSPTTTPPLETVAAGLDATGAMFEARRAHARARSALVAAHPELLERELVKLATLAAVVAETLRGRGVPEPTASLTAEAGIAVFKVGFERWVRDPEERDLKHHLRAALAQLRAVTAGPGADAPSAPVARSPAKAPPARARRKRPRPR